MTLKVRCRLIAAILTAAALFSPKATHAQQVDWSTYNGGVDGDHYSPLQQITPANVTRLRQVWRFDAGREGGLQTNPLIVGHRLFGYTSDLQVIALDARTGERLWHFDSGVEGGQPSRGLTYWTDGHQSRLFAYVMNFLIALDPATGKPILSFGEGGRLDMRRDLDSDYTQNNVAMTTPGVLYKNLLVVGFRAPETNPAPHGDIRAYNVLTGELVWSFHTIPHPGEDGYQTWPPDAWKAAGAANNWAGMSVDTHRGIVYVPTGSAVSDFYGFDRLGNNLFANTLLALDINTGRKLWYFQGVHHDIWDRDFPAAPALLTVRHDGKLIDAVAQTTKQGFVFVLDRVTGKPLFPLEERAFPASKVPGEVASSTQPIPTAPEPFARQFLTEDLLTKRTPDANAWAVKQFRTFRSAGQFLPFSVDQQTVVFPGFDGGGEWGGPAVNPRSGILYVNANDVPWTGGLTGNKPGGSPGQVLYQTQCAICHGGDLNGNPPAFPTLTQIEHRLTTTQIAGVIQGGKGRMPGFPSIQGSRLDQLINYLVHPVDSGATTVLDTGGKDPTGHLLYASHCALCHGEERTGEVSNYPGLLGVRARLTDGQILANIHNGKGRMPAIPRLSAADNAAILRFLGAPMEAAAPLDKAELASATKGTSQVPRYRFTGYRKFLDPDGYPAVAPPWGTLNAIDLNTGRFLWKVPLGSFPELAAQGSSETGSENYGGPVLSASGILFIAATIYDHQMRAFDASNGKLLWQSDLPFAGVATPSLYMVDGKEYVVIATSNARNAKAPQGAAYVAFALP